MSHQSFTVYEPAKVSKTIVAKADELVFVKDGFSFWAAGLSVFWMIYHQLWWLLAGFITGFIILSGFAGLLGVSPDANGLLFSGYCLGFGFIANELRRLFLEREGYQLVGAVAGYSQLECERRFFANWFPLENALQSEAKI